MSACTGPTCARPTCPGPTCPGPTCTRANLSRADLRGANLRGPTCAEPTWRGQPVLEPDLYGADLRETDLYGASVSHPLLSRHAKAAGSPSSHSRPLAPADRLLDRHHRRPPRTPIAGDDWPEAEGAEQDKRRPVLAAIADLVDAHIAYHGLQPAWLARPGR